MVTFQLPVFGLRVVCDPATGAGTIESELHSDEDDSELTAALDAIESLVLAHACAGVDIGADAYVQGLQAALDKVGQAFD